MKKPLLILHGALGAKSQFEELKQALQSDFTIHTLDFSGHGERNATDQPFHMEMFVQDVLDYLDENQLQQTDIFGYSMGGFVALLLAYKHPEKVNRIFTLATKFAWSPETAQKEVKLLDPEKIKTKVPAFAQVLAERHGENNWELVLNNTAALMLGLGNHNPLTPEVLQQIQKPVQLSVGDRDNMTSIEETVERYCQLPNAQLLVLPNTHHPFEKVNLPRITSEIRLFFL